MGQEYSFLAAEKLSWAEHRVNFNDRIRDSSLKLLPNFLNDANIYLTHIDSTYERFQYQHWFITDQTYFLEFGTSMCNPYNACVTINTNVYEKYPTDCKNGIEICRMNDLIRKRMEFVIGMSNFSFCLRNSEHVAKYVFRGEWISQQMGSHGASVMKVFKSILSPDELRLVNTYPQPVLDFVLNRNDPRVYSFIQEYFRPTGVEYYLNYIENTYNILAIGPTGAGKSRLINTIFNTKIANATVSLHSVTRDVIFIRGRGQIYDNGDQEERDIIVADTIGICDSELDHHTVINMIKNRVNSNYKYIDAVLIVCQNATGRLQETYVPQIQKFQNWLRYKDYKDRFHFIITHSEHLSEGDESRLKEEAIKALALPQDTSIIFTSFPPENALNDQTSKRVLSSCDKIMEILQHPKDTNRIEFTPGRCAIL